MLNLDKELKQLNIDLEYHTSLVTIHNKEVGKIKDRIKKLKASKSVKVIEVSDHAIVSYMRRFKFDTIGLDVEEVRDIIKDIVTQRGLQIGGNGKLTINGVTYVLKNHSVVTIYDSKNTD